MKVEVEIGQMHRFELREALLIYREGRRSFITRHEVLVQKQGPPVLGVAQPLTTGFVVSLAESLGGSAWAEYPEDGGSVFAIALPLRRNPTSPAERRRVEGVNTEVR